MDPGRYFRKREQEGLSEKGGIELGNVRITGNSKEKDLGWDLYGLSTVQTTRCGSKHSLGCSPVFHLPAFHSWTIVKTVLKARCVLSTFPGSSQVFEPCSSSAIQNQPVLAPMCLCALPPGSRHLVSPG